MDSAGSLNASADPLIAHQMGAGPGRRFDIAGDGGVVPGAPVHSGLAVRSQCGPTEQQTGTRARRDDAPTRVSHVHDAVARNALLSELRLFQPTDAFSIRGASDRSSSAFARSALAISPERCFVRSPSSANASTI